jgi:hypothetical protein
MQGKFRTFGAASAQCWCLGTKPRGGAKSNAPVLGAEARNLCDLIDSAISALTRLRGFSTCPTVENQQISRKSLHYSHRRLFRLRCFPVLGPLPWSSPVPVRQNLTVAEQCIKIQPKVFTTVDSADIHKRPS